MFLTPPRLQAWIAALKADPQTRITPEDNDPWDPMPPETSWGLTVYATAYFGIDSDAKEARLRKAIPASFRAFDALTQERMTHYHDERVRHRDKPYSSKQGSSAWIGMEERYAATDNQATINSFSGALKGASPDFKFRSIASFHPKLRVGTPLYMLDYLSVSVPLGFFKTQHNAFMQWWQSTVTDLEPAQAYMGLCIGMPSELESMGAIEPADCALARAFYGYDIDKPFFMRSNEHDGLYLDDGMRTPSFGVLVRGEYLQKLGGADTLRSRLLHPDIRVSDLAGGLWIEAGQEPQLYPVEEGIPGAMAQVAQALKPVRLERMKLTGMLEVTPRTDIFTVETAKTWLARFDGWTPTAHGGSPASTPPALSALPGTPCPLEGWWFAPNDGMRELFMRAGEPMPGQGGRGAVGSVIWYYKQVQK
ncbi:hypothetical protein os1_23200 [Comamonadaceae bacterium OS-1]|nr:hypothetical protein os1_23200 [Comamonadaceae bacterium OS-1]